MQHERKKDKDNEDVKFIGVFSTETKAKKTIFRLRNKPGFRDHLDGFYIDKYEIDKDHWIEGYEI